jgi:hypothetical protein
LPDAFLHQAGHGEMLADCGLDSHGIEASVSEFISSIQTAELSL